jgi:hypothetical protein
MTQRHEQPVANEELSVKYRRLRARIDADLGAHYRAQISRFGAAPAPFLQDAMQIR